MKTIVEVKEIYKTSAYFYNSSKFCTTISVASKCSFCVRNLSQLSCNFQFVFEIHLLFTVFSVDRVLAF